MYKVEKRFIKNPAFLFYNTLKMLLQNIFYLTLRVPKSVVNYKLKFQLNFNSNKFKNVENMNSVKERGFTCHLKPQKLTRTLMMKPYLI